MVPLETTDPRRAICAPSCPPFSLHAPRAPFSSAFPICLQGPEAAPGPQPPAHHSNKLVLQQEQASEAAAYARQQSELQHQLSADATAPAPAQDKIKAEIAANQAAFVAQQEALQKKGAALSAAGLMNAQAPSTAPAPASRHLLQGPESAPGPQPAEMHHRCGRVPLH